MSRSLAIAALPLGVAAAILSSGPVFADGGSNTFITSAHENADFTVTLPLHVGSSHGQKVYYVITDTDNGGLAQSSGVNRSQKLANASGSQAVRLSEQRSEHVG